MSRYKTKSERTIIVVGKRRSHKIQWVFMGILLFLVFFVPIYGTTLRYDVSIAFRTIFSAVGELCLTFGGVLTIFSILFSILSRRKFYLKSFIFGVVLLWIGAFLTDTQFSFFGYLFGGTNPDPGYY